MRNAMIVAKRLGLTQKSRPRDRRPTLDELDKLMAHFLDRSIRRPTSVPMHRVIAFAIFSTRRQEEITRITWADLDKDGKRVLVRDKAILRERERIKKQTIRQRRLQHQKQAAYSITQTS